MNGIKTLAILSLPLLCIGTGRAVAQSDRIQPDLKTFDSSIVRFIKQHCADCHGSDTQEGDVRLDTISGDLIQGDAAAVNQLLDRHRESLRHLIRMRLDRAVAQRVDASDVVQDVLLEASQRLQDYITGETSMPFHLWLRQLAKDRVIDMYRRHRGAQRRSVDREQGRAYVERSSLDLMAQLQDQELTPAAASIRQELEQRFLEALEELGEEDREIILMRHTEHLGNNEIAQALGISPAAAGMRHLRALRRLRTILGEPPSQM